MKLQNKIPLYVVAVILVIGGLGGMAVLSIQKRASAEQFKETASALTVTILNGLEQDMLRGIQGHIQETLDSLPRQGSVGEVDIISSQNVIWASTDRSAIGTPGTIESREVIENASAQSVVSNPAGGYLSVAVPIPAKDKCLQCHGKVADAPNPQGLLGAIRVDISTAALDESLDKSRDVMILLGGITFILVTVTLVLLLRRSVLNPLSTLTAAAGRISGGDYSARLPVQNNQSELGAVASAFNHMANQVEEHTRQLEVANRELERTNRMKSEFLANMSHELRTPLNVIIGFSEVLRDTPPESLSEKERQEFCENIVSSGYHLLELINDVLDLAKVEAGQMQLSPEEFYVATALKEIIATLRPLAAKKKINLDVTVSDRLSSIVADIGKFKQIIYNLVGNAIKFTPPGGSVSVSAVVMGDMARFAVADTGVGIAPADQERIFSEFQQVDGSSSREYEGTGLGLALTRKFVEMQGGRIWVESEVGQGSTFYFTLPLPTEKALPAALPAHRQTEALPPGTEAQKEVKSPAGKTPEAVAEVAEAEELPAERMAQATRILVVEDDPKTADLIGYWLQQEGYQVDYATDGIQAIEKAKSTHPFAVCLDIMLPRRDGWQVLHQLKSDPSTADVGVIICSALDNPDLGFALGAADYCVKPLSRRPLLDKLRHLQQVTPSKHSQPQVLVADSDLKAAEATAAILERQGFAVVKAHNGAETKEKALEYCPDVIILDLKIAGASSYDVISFLQKHPVTVDIPVVVTTDKSLSAQEEQILDKNHVEKVIHKREDSREQLLREIFRLEKLHPERAKMVDPETRLFNRRYFEKRLAEEIKRAERYALNLSVLLIEIDKTSKEKVPHELKLAALAGLLRGNMRAADPLSRYDTDRFAVLLPEISREAGIKVAHKLVKLVRSQKFRDDAGNPFDFTVSIAVCDCPNGSIAADQLTLKLESALTDIVKKGGNEARLV